MLYSMSISDTSMTIAALHTVFTFESRVSMLLFGGVLLPLSQRSTSRLASLSGLARSFKQPFTPKLVLALNPNPLNPKP